MKEITLTKGAVTIVDNEDYDWLTEYRWYFLLSKIKGHKPYACRNFRGNDGHWHCIRMHRAIINAPAGMDVDHINGDGLDNRRANLRLVTERQNVLNRRGSDGMSSVYKGVSLHLPGVWRARIRDNGRCYHIGLYATPEEAARAYDERALELFGEFAWLNFGGAVGQPKEAPYG